MDFEPFQKTLLSLFVAAAAAFTSIFNADSVSVSLQNPLVENLSSEVEISIAPPSPGQVSGVASSEARLVEIPQSLALEAMQQAIMVTPTAQPTAVPTPKPTIKPTVKPTTAIPTQIVFPTFTPTPTPNPTKTPTPTPTPKIQEATMLSAPASESTVRNEIVLIIPTPRPVINEYSLDADKILELINAQRKALVLPPFEKDEKLCRLAEYRAPQLYDEIFVTGKLHAGLYSLNLPYFITENMAHFKSEQQAVTWWMGSYVHKTAILGSYKYSCGACAGNSCAQLFTNFTPKFRF